LKRLKRYRNLKEVCENNRILAKRIKMLLGFVFIESVAFKEENRYVNCYKLTKRGEKFLARVEKLF